MTRIQTLVCDLLTAKGDKVKFFQTLQSSGCKGIRIFGSWLWGDGPQCQPFKMVGKWTHPTSHETFNLYDLGKVTSAVDGLDTVYFAKVREIMNLCKQYGQILVFSFVDHRNPDKHRKYWSPFVCSQQAFDLPGGFYGAGMVPYQLKYMNRVIYWADKLGVDMRYEIANEFDMNGWTTDRPLQWYQEILAGLNAPRSKMIHSGVYRAEIQALGIRYCYHRIGQPDQIKAIMGNGWASGDGFYAGTGDSDHDGKRGVGLHDATSLGPALKSMPNVNVYEYMSRRLWFADYARANLDQFNSVPLTRLVTLTR